MLGNSKGVENVADDSERHAFARQLVGVLEEAGWKFATTGEGHYRRENPIGLNILVHDLDNVPPRTKSLYESLAAIGFPVANIVAANSDLDGVILIVGTKP